MKNLTITAFKGQGFKVDTIEPKHLYFNEIQIRVTLHLDNIRVQYTDIETNKIIDLGYFTESEFKQLFTKLPKPSYFLA
jgi:hypothetical protein